MKEDRTSCGYRRNPDLRSVNPVSGRGSSDNSGGRDEQVIESISRHDLIRAMTGAGLGFEK